MKIELISTLVLFQNVVVICDHLVRRCRVRRRDSVPSCCAQVTTLVSQKGPSRNKKGRSKKAHVLSAAVQKAAENFITNGDVIANENPQIRNEMLQAVDDVRRTGGGGGQGRAGGGQLRRGWWTVTGFWGHSKQRNEANSISVCQFG